VCLFCNTGFQVRSRKFKNNLNKGASVQTEAGPIVLHGLTVFQTEEEEEAEVASSNSGRETVVCKQVTGV
jgi:hypothetical protein